MIYNTENNTYEFIIEKRNFIEEPFPSLDPKSVYISNGLINGQFMITGYIKGRWNLLLLESFNSTDVRFLGNVTISGDLDQGHLLCVTIDNSHYVYLPGESIVIQILSFEDNIMINNSIVIDMDRFKITSMQPSHNYTSLLFGFNCGFFILSLDFERSYFHIFENNCYMHVYSSIDHNYFLAIEDYKKIYISASEQNNIFTILGKAYINLDLINFSWTVYANSTGQEFLIISHENVLYQKEIILVGAYINFTSSDDTILYSLSVYNQVKNEMMINNFTVTKLENFEEIFLVEREEDYLVSFYNLNGSLEINLYDYFFGSDLELANCNIFCDTNEISAKVLASYKNISVCSFSEGIQSDYRDYESDCMGNFEKLWPLSIEDGNFVVGNHIYVYNRTGIQSLEDNSTFYEPFGNYSIIKIISCGAGFFFVLEKNQNIFIDYSDIIFLRLFMSPLSVGSCLNPQCSNNYFTCQNITGIIIYTFAPTQKIPILEYFYYISPNQNNETGVFINYTMIDYSIAALTNNQTFMLYNIDNSIYRTINFIYKMYLTEPSLEIYADNTHYYIITYNNMMLVYSYTLKYEKQIYIGPYAGINIINSLVFVYSNSYLNVFNASLFVGNAKIFTMLIDPYASITIEETSFNVIGVFLIGSNNILYENSLLLTCKVLILIFLSIELHQSFLKYTTIQHCL